MLQVGDTATYWHRRPGKRAQRVWVTILEVDPTAGWARVRRPSGWPLDIITLALERLTKADPAEGRRAPA